MTAPLLRSFAFPDAYTDIQAAELYANGTACRADDVYRNKAPQPPQKSAIYTDHPTSVRQAARTVFLRFPR